MTEVSLHPLVIMNISDHFTRHRAQNDGKPQRVLGAIMGTQEGRKVEIFNSFEFIHRKNADGTITIDENFLNERLESYSKIFPDYECLGWYSSYLEDPTEKSLESDLHIHKQIMKLNENPLYLVLSSRSASTELPVTLFETVVQVESNVTTSKFNEIHYKVETVEAERISVDHVAKNVSSTGTQSAYAQNLLGVMNATRMLRTRLQILHQFVKDSPDIQKDHKFMRQLNGVCNRLPAIESEEFETQFLQGFTESLLLTYLSTLTKGASQLDDLIGKFQVMRSGGGGDRRHHQIMQP
mmetsp:Transcript_6661/g.7424  ORF Transcript_6661/g.7424 Transcript_6661/m.7424 type:complete len:296 (+) Transcript_6661:133-1020(+)|eukprot:CAMPEP_0115005762 /NCGR_PEP_ID=MMETSP0216-20121206/20083_1 /TAXON_ID=223996 /ORGANISM="Protocruzia adherens, Strain Boccale" /LENGTH=295 /DNA_ID=CAMNT_0002372187 /DNA_START=52 /DNA_END=939 /DNA_ORIENTATION=+